MFSTIHIISLFSILLPLLAGLILYKNLEAISRIILLMLVFASLSQLGPFFLSKENATLFYNLYILVDVSFWGYVFTVSQKNIYLKLLTVFIWMLHISLSFFVFARYGIDTRFYNELVCMDSLAQVVWVLIYILSLYYKENVEGLEKKPMFWFCIGILLYATSSYFLFAFYDDIKTNKYEYLWRLHDVVNMIMYLFFTAGILINRIQYKAILKQKPVYG